MRRTLAAMGAAALLAGCSSGPESSHVPLASGGPPPLASLHRQAGRLLDGGPTAFRARLHELHGYPVVVNKWASWCGPCRAEFPFFQRQSRRLAHSVAFIGVNSNDNDGQARRFLARFPVGYPSYRDPKLAIAAVFNGVQAFPTTAFYDEKGRLAYLHQGAYATEAKLAQDIDRYAR